MVGLVPVALAIFVFAATLWLGMQTALPQQAVRRAGTRSAPTRHGNAHEVAAARQHSIERSLVLQMQPVYDFADYISLLSMLNQTTGVSGVRALGLGHGVGQFQVMLSGVSSWVEPGYVASVTLGHQVQFKIADVADDRPSEQLDNIWSSRGRTLVTGQARSWLAWLTAPPR